MKTYNIDGNVYTQKEITAEDAIDLMDLISEVDFKGKNPIKVIKAIKDSGKLYPVLNTIVKGKDELSSESGLSFKQLQEIVSDFFTINDVFKIISDLTSVFQTAATGMKTQQGIH